MTTNDDPLAQDLARQVGALAPRPHVRARLLTSIEGAPQESAAAARRSWALGAAAAAVLLGVMLWLGSRSADEDGEPPTSAQAAARDPWEEPPEVAKQRAENEACYEREKGRLHRDHKGKNFVIVRGRLHGIEDGSTEPAPPSAGVQPVAHAFSFEVGEDGPRTASFFSQWYAPRFAGAILPELLGADWSMGSESRLKKLGKPDQVGIGPVFPRLRFDFFGPARGPGRPLPRLLTQEVFVGSVGPPLMLTPEDAVALELFRWEIPGVVTVWERFHCRQATVAVSVAGWDEPQLITALWPIEPRAWLTALARERDRFWNWGGTLADTVVANGVLTVPGVDAPWLLFGRDRVLARGVDLAGLLEVVDADPEPTYHRFLMRWPREGALVIEEASLEPQWGEATLNGRKTRCRASRVVPVVDGKLETPNLLVEPADALALQIDARAEEAREMRLRRADGTETPLLGGYAWGPGVDAVVGDHRVQLPPAPVRVVYVLPPPPPPAPMPAPGPHPGGR